MRKIKVSYGYYVATLLSLLFSIFCVPFFISSIISCYTYTNIYDKTVTVEAVVTDYRVDRDSEGADKYFSCCEYTYEGKTYRSSYECCLSRRELSPIGTVVQIEINPNKPDELLIHLEGSSSMSVFWGTPIVLFLLLILKLLQHNHLLKKHPIEILDNDTIEYYLKALIKCNFLRSFVLAFLMFFLFLNLCFPLLFNFHPVVIALSAVYLGLSFFDVYRWCCIKKHAYTVYRGKFKCVTLERYSEDGDTVYHALFTFEEDYPEYRYRIDKINYYNYTENSQAYSVLFNYNKIIKKHCLVFIKNVNTISAHFSIY